MLFAAVHESGYVKGFGSGATECESPLLGAKRTLLPTSHGVKVAILQRMVRKRFDRAANTRAVPV